jgi:hypothetical protein
MRRAKLEGRHIGRRPLDVDRRAILRDRDRRISLTNIAKAHRISRSMVSKVLRDARRAPGHEGFVPTTRKQAAENGGLS